jgi:hypothetical protein
MTSGLTSPRRLVAHVSGAFFKFVRFGRDTSQQGLGGSARLCAPGEGSRSLVSAPPEPIGADTEPEPSHRRPQRVAAVVTGSVALLIATVLYQRPLAKIYLGGSGGSGLSVHSWDIAWLVLLSAAVGFVVRSRRDLMQHKLRRPMPWADPLLWMVGVVAYAAVSLVWAYENFGQAGWASSLAEFLHLLAAAGLAVLIRVTIRDRNRDVLVWSFIIASTASALWALLAWRLESSVVTTGSRTISYGVTRAGGPFGNSFSSGTSDGRWVPSGASNALGFWLAVCIPVALFHAAQLRVRQRWLSFTLLGAVPLLVAGILGTHSRESWLAALVGCVVIGAWCTPAISRRRKMTALAIVVIVLSVVGAVLPSIRARVGHTLTPGSFDYRTGPVARTAAWSAGLRWATERLPIGWGLGAMENHAAAFGGRTTAENVFIQYFAELGIPGLIGLIALVWAGLRRALWTLRRWPESLSGLFSASFFITLVVHGMFGNTLGDPTIQILLGCAVGLALTESRMRSPASATS